MLAHPRLVWSHAISGVRHGVAGVVVGGEVGWGYLRSGTLLLLYGRGWLELYWWFQYPSCTMGLPKFKDCEFPSCDFRFETGLMSHTNRFRVVLVGRFWAAWRCGWLTVALLGAKRSLLVPH